eukprot:scaffold518_cov388-Prasinococcus_capsulatus_cf.AAC.56
MRVSQSDDKPLPCRPRTALTAGSERLNRSSRADGFVSVFAQVRWGRRSLPEDHLASPCASSQDKCPLTLPAPAAPLGARAARACSDMCAHPPPRRLQAA